MASELPLLFDSHCHLTDDRFAADVEAVLARARAAGVTRIVTVGSDAEDSGRAATLAAAREGVWCAVGIHPHVASTADDAVMERIAALAAGPEVVAIGETGLDYHYDHSPRDVQRAVFARHLELGAELGLPVVVHSRAADLDTAALVREAAGAVTGVLHCFTGGRALLEAGLEAGWYISFAGMVSFRKYDDGDLVRHVPDDRILVETDSPYLAPVPMRGKRNEPAFVRHVAEAAAAIRGADADAFAALTTRNALAFFGLDGTPARA